MQLLFRRRLVLLFTLCAACEFHVGDGKWDGSFDVDDEDAGQLPHDAAVRQDDAEDAGPSLPDAAADGGNRDAAVAPTEDASVMDSGADASAEAPDPASPLTVDDVAEVLARGSCGALEACMGEVLLRESLTGKDCIAYRTQVYRDRDVHWLAKSVSLGRVTFRAAQLATCEEDLLERGCNVQSRRLPASCRSALEGHTALDQVCAIDQECKGSAFCDKGMLETCPGACAALQPDGLPCAGSAQCVDGLVCRAGLCAAPLSEGDGCTVRGGYGECPPGLVCQGTANALSCRSIATVYVGKLGDACDATGQLCESGLVCASQSAGTTGRCALPVPANGTCRRSVPNQCPANQYCKDAGAGILTRAAPGTDGVCADLPATDSACDAAIGCRPGALCGTDDLECHELAPISGPCTESRECYGGDCRDGECAAPLDCSM